MKQQDEGARAQSCQEFVPSGLHELLLDNPDLHIVLYKSSDDGKTFHIDRINRTLEDFLGVKSAKIQKKSPVTVFGKTLGGMITENLQACLNSKLSQSFEFRLLDGSEYRWFRTRMTPYMDGKTCVIAAVSMDVTEQKLAEEKLENAQLTARLAARSKKEFLSNMSHEFRTPLNAIIGFAEIMQTGLFGKLENEKYEGYMEHILESAKALLGNVNDILDLAGMESVELTLNESEFDIIQSIHHCLNLMAPRAIASGLELQKHVFATPIMVKGDRIKLQQAITNLLSNAVKYTPAGGVVSLETWIGENRGFLIRIKDTGCGMSTEQVREVTAPFAQGGDCMTRGEGGIGLGLTLADRFICQHDGQMRLDSEEGVGTLVTVELPAERLVAAPDQPVMRHFRMAIAN